MDGERLGWAPAPGPQPGRWGAARSARGFDADSEVEPARPGRLKLENDTDLKGAVSFGRERSVTVGYAGNESPSSRSRQPGSRPQPPPEALLGRPLPPITKFGGPRSRPSQQALTAGPRGRPLQQALGCPSRRLQGLRAWGGAKRRSEEPAARKAAAARGSDGENKRRGE